MTTFYTSNDPTLGFDATTTGTLPSAWANKVGTWQVGTTQPTGSHTKSLGSTTHNDGDVALATGMTTQADMSVSYTQKIPNLGAGNAPMIGVILRMDAAYQNGYTVVISAAGGLGSLRLMVFKRVGGAYSLIATSATIPGITFASTDTVMLRAQIQGSAIGVKLWPTRISEPAAWHISLSDSSVSAAGYAGLYYALDSGSSVTMAIDDFIVTDATSLSVANAGSVGAGAPMLVSGTYTGPDPTGLNYQFDAAGYTAAPSPTIGSGAFSFTVTAPSAGTHTVSVQEANNTAVSGTSSAFTAGAAALGIATPGTVLSGQVMTLSGTYTGAAPTGLNVRFDSGTYTSVASPTIGGGAWSCSVTAPGFGPHTVSVQEANNTAITATSGSFTANAAPNDAGIAYSPYTWNIQSTSATTANPGAFFRTLFTGTVCTLTFDVSAMVSPASQIWWRIDNGPWTQANVAASIACTVPTATAGNADVPYHLLEVIVKSSTETQNRWNTGSSTRVVFTGLGLAAGALLAAPGAAPINVLVFGDSITEGVRALGESAANDTDRNDAALGWAFRLGALLGAEIGVVGFGAQGLLSGGSGNVPSLPSAYASLYAGATRSFATAPALIVFNIGTNDGAGNTISAMTTLLNGIIAACPTTPIAVLRPFNGAQSANLQSAIAGCANPSACHWIDTTGFFSTGYGADSLNLHPSGPNNIGRIAPLVAAALRPLIAGSGAMGFRAGFQRGLLG